MGRSEKFIQDKLNTSQKLSLIIAIYSQDSSFDKQISFIFF